MEFAKEITGFRPGCRCGHALSAASLLISVHDRGKFSIGSCHMRCKPALFFKSLKFFSVFRTFANRAHHTPVSPSLRARCPLHERHNTSPKINHCLLQHPWKCVDTAKPSRYFSTAQNFSTSHLHGGTAHRHHGVRR